MWSFSDIEMKDERIDKLQIVTLITSHMSHILHHSSSVRVGSIIVLPAKEILKNYDK